MAAAGLAVTRLSLAGKARATTAIYHRGARGPTIAARANELLGIEAKGTPLKKRGWLDLVILLERDALGAP